MSPENSDPRQLTIQLLIGLAVLGLIFAILRILFPVLVLAAIAAGAWWVWKNYSGSHRSTQHQLKAAFYQLLEQNQGRITLMDFAFKTNLLGKEAKRYLDDRAKEFSASFEVDEQGNVVYCFGVPAQFSKPYSPANPPRPQPDLSLPTKPLTQAELAQRLDVSSATLNAQKQLLEFPEWSRDRDPDGIAWSYLVIDDRFVPLSDA